MLSRIAYFLEFSSPAAVLNEGALHMRRLLFAAAALTIAFSVATTTEAAERCPQCGQVHSHTVQSRPAANPFQKLMEIERRKNAWLALTFLGR